MSEISAETPCIPCLMCDQDTRHTCDFCGEPVCRSHDESSCTPVCSYAHKLCCNQFRGPLGLHAPPWAWRKSALYWRKLCRETSAQLAELMRVTGND